jgi:hypothetical protein
MIKELSFKFRKEKDRLMDDPEVGEQESSFDKDLGI